MELTAFTSHVNELVRALNEISGLGIAAGLAWVIYILVSKNGPVSQLSNNHLSGLPRMEKKLDKIHITLKQGFADMNRAPRKR